MNSCLQTEGLTILDHGIAVWRHTQRIMNGQTECMRLPKWWEANKDFILSNLHDKETIRLYTTFHDCGKPKCLTIDENGKRHFPNHAEISRQTWLEYSDNETIANLIGLDMMFHTESAEQILARDLPIKDLMTLLIAALAEIHANAEMFGGIESESFKIKFKRLEQRGKRILMHYNPCLGD